MCVSSSKVCKESIIYIYIGLFQTILENPKSHRFCVSQHILDHLSVFFCTLPSRSSIYVHEHQGTCHRSSWGKIHRLLGCGKKPSRAEWPHEQVLQGFQPTTASPFPVRTQDWSIRSSPKPSTFRSAKKDTRCEVRHTLCGKILAMIAINPGLRTVIVFWVIVILPTRKMESQFRRLVEFSSMFIPNCTPKTVKWLCNPCIPCTVG